MDKRNSKTNMLQRIKYLEDKIENVYGAGKDGIGYLGLANYQSREEEAIDKLEEAMYSS